MDRNPFVFHSALAPNVICDVLRRTTDEEQWTLFSLSGYRGDHPLLAEVGEETFRLRKRRVYSRNDFAAQLYARFEPEQGGTRIECRFDIPRWAKYFMRFWLAGVVLLGAPIFLMTLADLTTGSHYISGDKWVGLVVPPSLILFGIILPRLGRLLSRWDERFILEYVETTLAARVEDSKLAFGETPTRG